MAVSAVTAFLPSVVSKSIFAPRRADKSFESNNTPAGILNAGIAVMQLSKLGDGVAAIAKENKGNVPVMQARNLAGESIFSDISRATNKITKHVSINGFIGLAALANVLAAEDKDKKKALLENGGIYGGMLAAEGAHKLICGTVKTDGDKIIEKEGLYRQFECLSKPVDKLKVMCEKQAEALKDCGEVKRFIGKVIKCAPPLAKGFTFALTSITGSFGGYKLCKGLAEQPAEA